MDIDLLSYQIPVWLVILLWVVSAAINNLPQPNVIGNTWYTWIYDTLQTVAANIKLIGQRKVRCEHGEHDNQSETKKS